MKKQKGFTIIELVVVILLLGILTATALPRFMDVTDEAHDSVVDGVYSGLNSGLALFKAQWTAEGQPGTGTTVSEFSLDSSLAGYPTGSDGDAQINAVTDCTAIYGGLLQSGAPSTVEGTSSSPFAAGDIAGGADFEIFHDGGAGDPCYFAYTGQYSTHADAAASGDTIPIIQYDADDGSLTRTDSGSI